MEQGTKKIKRRQLSPAEDYHLWVACGGVCSFEGCNRRLIESSSGNLTNGGIKAHIIGHAKGSARHEYMEKYEYTQETLEDVSNLMLMCYPHSKYIDDKHTRNQFPPDRLFKMKKDHEERVASWAESKKKKSIALIHKRMGGPLADIEYDGEAPYILLDAVEDQTVFDDFTREGWENGKERNEKLYQKFLKKIKEKDANVGEIFPLSPIPLLIHLGSLLTDTVPYSIYQFNRETGLWVSANLGENKNITLTCSKDVKECDELAVLVSISGIVKIKSVEEVLEKEFDVISFEINEPGLKRVLYKEDVVNIQAKIKDEIEKLLQRQDYSKIHLFYAGPAGLAIEIGRGINPNIWSEVYLYQYNNRMNPKYQYALSI
ncbi:MULTISPECIES: SAVED domain-containing protein [Bacillus cereus group]|uniref:SAVED domain-containing protein n=1 Tax=Bacillus cereus group TaxID=86661 RepID=UPI0022E90768|nr:SAVED domain-containing protein [Bacillus cereus]MDF9630503.1 SAVED domain-containing protein [Bacillus cereus]MDF9635157.1 SAVED domain-containing protein [Bacillus cereus]MDG1583621.1 SAVED domain-containing protein [Bacillus cereus]MDZ4503313.1 SAVED domain-containing protein [Bacillus cereus]WKT32991.1 SAVED domain-containing protein [Bacillus cereus]